MDLFYRIVSLTVKVEFFLVLFIIFLAYLLKVIALIRNKRQEKKENDLIKLLNKLKKHSNIQIKNIPRKYLNLKTLFIAIKKIDQTNPDKSWSSLRRKIVKEGLLPLARKNYLNKDWMMRLFSSESFSFHYEKEDEQFVKKLTNDTIPLVKVSALNAALSYSEKLVDEIILSISKERRFSQDIYLQAFLNFSKDKLVYIENLLNKTTDPYVHSICYKIMLHYKIHRLTWNMEADLNSNTLELKLSAIRFYTHFEQQEAIPTLIRFLYDPAWEVRVVSLVCLEDLCAKKAIDQIANCLHDSEWWVRLHAAKALKKIGEKGVEILKNQTIEQDRFAYEIAQYILGKHDAFNH